MSSYQAPLRDMQFVLRELAGLEEIAKLPGCEEVLDVAEPILEEAATFASEVLDPINQTGDEEGCTWQDGNVTTPKGFKEAYQQFAKAGWIGLPVPPEYGGQGLPSLMLGPTLEMWNASNVGFANGPLLNQGAIEAIELVGTEEQKQLYIPKLVDGTWTGTMCLTEPQAGSDLAQVRTKAVPSGDHYLLSGQKIFITFGEHDMAENIVHLVLARLPDAPEGTKGISLFIVPMFIMMNAARFSVGVQGMAIADRAYQSALQYAKERVQFRDVASRSAEPKRIIEHPDVRRMLMWMKSQIEAMRALSYVTAAALDLSHKHPDEKVRKENAAFVDLMIPVVKGWCTESAVDICSTALQVFGGIGYVEETGIAQQYRDVRITTIYEGTTGIQALDLVGRKLAQDMGATATRVIGTMQKTAKQLSGDETSNAEDLRAIGRHLEEAIGALSETSQFIGMTAMGDLRKAFACSVPYLKLWGVTAGGWQMARAALVSAEKLAQDDAEAEFYKAKIATARFYASHVLTQSAYLKRQILDGSGDVMALSESQFDLDRKSPVVA